MLILNKPLPYKDKMMAFFKREDTKEPLYNALLDEKFTEAKILMEKGHRVPEILYAQVTGHDDPKIFGFLFDQLPNKQGDLISLAVCQGALQCLKWLAENRMASFSADLLFIQPRKNSLETIEYLKTTIKLGETNSAFPLSI